MHGVHGAGGRPAPQLWVFAGPNGAGKSTLAARQVRGRLPVVNPDDIARGLPPGRDGGVDVLAAGRVALQERDRFLSAGTSFAIETTLTGRGELSLMSRAKEAGYTLQLWLILARVDGRTRVVSRRLPAWVERVLPPDLVRADPG